MQQRAVVEIGDGAQADVRMWPHIDTLADREVGWPHVVHEQERPDAALRRVGQHAQDGEPATEIGGAPLESRATIHPPVIVGDDVFVRDESVARVFTPGRKTPFEVNDIAVYHGSLKNLVDPTVKVGDATVFFAEVTSWQRWMKMDDAPGSLTSRLTGRKLRRFDDLPEVFRRKLAQMSPEIAADPIAALDRPAPKFDR